MNAQKSWEKDWKAEMLGVVGTVLGLVDVLLLFMLMCIALEDSPKINVDFYYLFIMLPLGIAGLICSIRSVIKKRSGFGKAGIFVNCAKLMLVLGFWTIILVNFFSQLPLLYEYKNYSSIVFFDNPWSEFWYKFCALFMRCRESYSVYSLTTNNLVSLFQTIVLLVIPAVAPLIASHILEIKNTYKTIISVISVISGSLIILGSSWRYIPGVVFVVGLVALTIVNYIVLTVGIYQADYLSYDNNDIRRTGKNLWIMNVYIYGAIAVIGLFVSSGFGVFLSLIFVGAAVLGAVINAVVRNAALVITLNSLINLAAVIFGLSTGLDIFGIILCVLGIAACLSNIVEIYGISCQHFGRISTQANN